MRFKLPAAGAEKGSGETRTRWKSMRCRNWNISSDEYSWKGCKGDAGMINDGEGKSICNLSILVRVDRPIQPRRYCITMWFIVKLECNDKSSRSDCSRFVELEERYQRGIELFSRSKAIFHFRGCRLLCVTSSCATADQLMHATSITRADVGNKTVSRLQRRSREEVVTIKNILHSRWCRFEYEWSKLRPGIRQRLMC